MNTDASEYASASGYRYGLFSDHLINFSDSHRTSMPRASALAHFCGILAEDFIQYGCGMRTKIRLPVTDCLTHTYLSIGRRS